jgi:uncharacterized protein involved in exopolysaccharide biosynthesis
MEGAIGNGTNILRIYPRDILFIIFSKIHVFFGVFVIVVILVVVTTMKAVPVYEVAASVLIKPLVDSRLLLHANRFMVDPVTVEDVNSEIKLMSSRELMLRVMTKLGTLERIKKNEAINSDKKGLLVKLGIEYEASAEDKALNSIRSGLDISPVTVSHMIQITKTGEDPEKITEVVQTFLECYIDYHIEARKMVGAVDSYRKQVAFYGKKIYKIEEELKTFQKQWFIIAPEEQFSSNIKQIQLINDSLVEVQAEIADQQAKVSALKNSLKNGISPMIEEYRTSSVFTEINKVYLPLLVEKRRTALLYKKASPEYQEIDGQAKEMEKEIRKTQEELLAGIEVDLKALLRRESALQGKIDSIKAESTLLKEKEIERARLVRKLERYKKNHELYMDKLEEAQVAEELERSRVANVFVANRPRVPSVPAAPDKKARIFLAIPAGLIAGIGAAFAAFFLDHTVKRPEDLEKCTGVPVFSSIGVVRR